LSSRPSSAWCARFKVITDGSNAVLASFILSAEVFEFIASGALLFVSTQGSDAVLASFIHSAKVLSSIASGARFKVITDGSNAVLASFIHSAEVFEFIASGARLFVSTQSSDAIANISHGVKWCISGAGGANHVFGTQIVSVFT